MLEFENHIILDKVDSWPKEILCLIRNEEKALKNYLQEESRIDIIGRTDLSIRYNRPINIYSGKWEEVTESIELSLKEYNIIGIHCTRLMDYEITDILNNGLRPLSKDFANSRIEKLFEKGLISKELRCKLVDKEEYSDENRRGKISVFHCLSTLKDEWGLNRLFGIWGGESVYSEIQNPKELMRIGTSCIVLTSIKIRDFDIYPELSKRMLAIFFDDNYFPHDTDSFLETKLNVLKIIRREDNLFAELTGIQDWHEEI